ncbi:carboxymuconolactone decarboxylase family protein [Leucobacter sp. M11]|uniref:carboxymuconolactone decarboxylase family protein n=1 Tax=Leucobacter sp. M11 TaxID=2993565 RepID=UPI002D7E31B1|nr:carboxymuconolactone decarboxylase family protein [Leucobacter sp. M11]MEB4614088.1 carboxymuconolactone decarboxylase family protein [Leucobacter sp. M11]
MTRVPLIDPAAAQPAVAATLGKIESAFGGVIPNMFRATANSPAALKSMWASFGAFSTGALGAALTEQIAVAVADLNRCAYCLAAHTALGQQAGLDPAALTAAQQGRADDPKTEALLGFARDLADRRGAVDEQAVPGLLALGWTEEQVVETIAQVALNLFTNTLNIALEVPVDFPEVPFRS